MTEEETQQPSPPTPEQIQETVNGIRGQYLLSQALHYAIEALEAVEPEELQEKSNIEDMKYIYMYAFPLFKIARDMERKVGSHPDFIIDAEGGDADEPISKGD